MFTERPKVEDLIKQVLATLNSYLFMHWDLPLSTRQVELADKLPHVQSLCLHEMIVRAYKHILQAVVAAVDNVADLSALVASCLNMLLGTPSGGSDDPEIATEEILKCKWVETFILKRFGWQFKFHSCRDLRKFSVLRGVCHKVWDSSMKGFMSPQT